MRDPGRPRDEQLEHTPDEDDEDGASSWEYGVGQQAQPDTRTVLGMMFDKELVVNPEWQRNFVWPIKKQRRFIESILLGLPIPSLLLFEDIHTGTKYVIDGRQRLETLARYCATADQRQGLPFLGKRFRTFSAKEPNWREGQDLHDAANKYYEHLPPLHRRRVDRAVLTVFTFRSLEPRQTLPDIPTLQHGRRKAEGRGNSKRGISGEPSAPTTVADGRRIS